ncbi:GntR family transcriptional regulator [Corynebacterium sp. zg-331]|uniref:GntR family transcriptional regulator n=1 Tax=unclassified Corynebacterium TaxID=2624378 RepID=UPI00128D4C3D|nr:MULTISPECIES: GntR family transcriptional regulator [unclassified Corynebacterium]MBC3186837.1 GntR family transcriptional regulator [Corynebacterium sp. zg-331]MPV53317.1 UTRA domain-containing protein [Corynebacterium sp. zg331]
MPQPDLPPAEVLGGGPPKHTQLREILEEFCATRLSPGDMLPSERTIEQQYGVSRITVRRALGDLVAAGKIRRERGKGTFVAPSPLVSRPHLASFSSEMRAQDVEASSRILLAERSAPPPEVARWFGTPEHHPHIRLRRLRLGNNEPYAIDDAWYHAGLAPDLLETDVYNSVYTILERRYGLRITDATQTITAVNATTGAAVLLDVAPKTALLSIERQSRAGESRVEYCSSVYRTDRYQMKARVSRSRDDYSG